MKRFIAAAVLLCLSGGTAAAIDLEEAEVLVEKTDAAAIVDSMKEVVTKQVLRRIGANNPALPEAAADMVEDIIGREFEASRHELTQRYLDLYREHFTDQELASLVEFFQTPLGAKVAEVLPDIGQQSTMVAQQWGQEVGRRAARAALDAVRGAGYLEN